MIEVTISRDQFTHLQKKFPPPLGLQIPRSSFWGCTFFRLRNLMIVTTEYEMWFCGKYKHINELPSKFKS